MTNIFISLGSNVGDRELYLQEARQEMAKNDIDIIEQSSIYQTDAWGYEDQAPFLNQVIEISTTLSPEHLLRRLKKIENKMGRQKRKKWREREIDLDILYFGDRIIKTTDLQVPHRYIRERNFVLVPLEELAGEFSDPEVDETIYEILKNCDDRSKLTQYKP